jgi:hypothetical protein
LRLIAFLLYKYFTNTQKISTANLHNLCVEYKPRRNNDRRAGTSLDCKKYEKRKMITNLEYKRKKCVDYTRRNGRKKCSRYEDVYYTYPTKFKKTVRKQWWVGNSNNGNWGWPGRPLSSLVFFYLLKVPIFSKKFLSTYKIFK